MRNVLVRYNDAWPENALLPSSHPDMARDTSIGYVQARRYYLAKANIDRGILSAGRPLNVTPFFQDVLVECLDQSLGDQKNIQFGPRK